MHSLAQVFSSGRVLVTVALLGAVLQGTGCQPIDADEPPQNAGGGGAGGENGVGGSGATGGNTSASSSGAGGMTTCLGQTSPCTAAADCCEGLACDTTTLGQVCCGVEGGACATANGEDCCGDLLCVNSTCVAPSVTCQPNCLPLTWLADVLRDAGLTVIEDPNWLNAGHAYFDGIWGIIAHHTGVGSPDDWLVVRDGRPDLAGPLAQLVLEKDGTYRTIAAGVAWHAGQGSWPGLPDNNANFYTIGIEAVNNGVEGWSAEQYSAYVAGCAAIMRYLDYDASHVIGHKEWAVIQGKWDPGGIDMDAFRADIQAQIY